MDGIEGKDTLSTILSKDGSSSSEMTDPVKELTENVGNISLVKSYPELLDSDEERDMNAELFSAIRNNDFQKFQQLLDSGVPTNIIDRNDKYNTPLHYSVKKGRKRFIQLLLNSGADVTMTNRNNKTALELTEDEEIINIIRTHCSTILSNAASQQTETEYEEEVNERLREFVEFFDLEFEAKLLAYYMILEGKVEKVGKFSDTFSGKIGLLLGGVVGGSVGFVLGSPKTGATTGARIGAEIGQEGGKFLGGKIGAKQYKKKVTNLSHLIDSFQNKKADFRKKLVEAGFDIFQSFEMQFMRVTTERGPKHAMHELAKDAVNRAIDYLENNKDFSISESVILGKSKKESVLAVPISTSLKTPGFSLQYKYQSHESEWITSSVYEKVGLILADNKSYYKKNGRISKTGKYGYRRLLIRENWEILEQTHDIDNVPKSHSEQFTGYQYILDPEDLEKKSQDLLAHLNNNDEQLAETRIKEVIGDAKNDILEFLKVLKGNEDNAENFEFLVEIETSLKNLEEGNYLQFEEIKQHFEVVRQQSQEILHTIEDGIDDQKESFKQVNQKLDVIIAAKKEQGKKTREPIWFDINDLAKSFTGREDQLSQITEHIQSKIVVISGLPGMGKSELALKYAHSQFSKEDNVIWINAESYETIKESFLKLLKELGLKTTDSDGDEMSLESMSKKVYNLCGNKKSLLIFDNAEKYSAIEKILPLDLPNFDQKPYVLITSLNSDKLEWHVMRKDIIVVPISDFTEREAQEFIKKALKIKTNSNDVISLAEKLHHFPLALQHAVTYIRDTNEEFKERGLEFKISNYLEQYDQVPRKMLNVRLPTDGHFQTVYKTLEMLLDKIESDVEHGKLALDMLYIISYFPSRNISEDIFLHELANGDKEKLISITRLLKKYSIVSVKDGMINVHGLVQQVVRLVLKNLALEGKSLEEKILSKALELLKNDMLERITAESCMPHIISIWSHALEYDDLIEIFIVEMIERTEAYTTYFHLLAGSSIYVIIDTIIKKVEENNPKILEKVINAEDKDKGVPLHNAALSGDVQTLKLLIEKGANVNTEKQHGWTPLLLATKSNHTDVSKALIDSGANVNASTNQGNTSLHFAARNDNLEIVKVLLGKKADVNAKTHDQYTPLHLAARNGNFEIATTLLHKDGDVNCETKENFTPLHLATKNGNLKTVEALLDKDANVNAETKGKFTPLHFAAQRDCSELVNALLSKGANVNVQTTKGRTPLHFVAGTGCMAIASALIKKGANVNAKDTGNFTPLHLASFNGHMELVTALLSDSGIDIDVQTSKGNTSLHLASEKGNIKVIEILLMKGANIDVENEDGKTASDLAHDKGHIDVKNYIESKGHIMQGDEQLTFNRRDGAAGISGQLYEIELAMLLLLQGRTDEKISSFHLATNVKEAGDFDDVVLEYKYTDHRGEEKRKIIFVQAKHRKQARNEISLNTLLSETEKGDFLLKKYFSSYREIKQQFSQKSNANHPIFGRNFKDADFIIYTNTFFTYGESEEKNIKKVDVDNENILNFKDFIAGNEELQDVNSCYYQLVFGGNKEKKMKDTLKCSSDCVNLAKVLADCISSGKVIDINKQIVGKYHTSLAEIVIEKNSLTGGKMRTNFLHKETVSADDKIFQETFFEEIQKTKHFKGKSIDEVMTEISRKSIKIHEKFGGTKNSNTKPKLPSDLIQESEIKEFLSKLKIFVKQPNEELLGKIIKQKLQDEYKVAEQDVDSVFSDVEYKMRKWWQAENIYLKKNNKYFEESARISIKFDVKEPVTLFTGRTDELLKLHDILQNGGEVVISQMASVTGLGGVGKSELSRKYIKENGKDYDNNIIWINAENLLTTAESFRRLAVDKLGINLKDVDGKEKEIKSLIMEVYDFFAKRHRKSLFIFDNAGKYKALNDSDEGIDKFLPSGPDKPYVLITSRNQEWGEIQSLTLNVFTEKEAIEFIKKALKINDALQENEMQELASTLQFLPLALRQAVAYIDMENKRLKSWSDEIGEFTIRSYLDLYTKEAVKVFQSKTSLEEECGVESDRYTETVLTTWNVTVDKLKKKVCGIQAFGILAIVAYFAPDKIPIQGVFSKLISNDEELHNSIELLDQYSMATLEHGLLSVHRLVQQVTRIKLRQQYQENYVIDETFKLLEESFPYKSENVEDYPRKRQLLPHFEVFLSNLDQLKSENKKKIEEIYIEKLLTWMTDGYFDFGNPQRNKDLLERALKINENHYGPEHFEVAITLVDLGNTYGYLGDHQGKKHLLERALAINEEYYGLYHTEVAKTLVNLGNSYGRLGNPKEQKSFIERALDIFEKQCGPNHLDVARTLTCLGEAYGGLGEHEKRIELLERALAIDENLLDPDHFELAIILGNSGNAYGCIGKYQKTIDLLERALAINEKHFDVDHFQNEIILASLGTAYGKLGNYVKERELLERALSISVKHYGSDHFEVARTLVNLGVNHGEFGEHTKQKELLERALVIQVKHYGKDNFEVAWTLATLSEVYEKLDEPETQRDLLQRALPILENHYGSDNFPIAKILENLGMAYGKLGDHCKKNELYQRAFPIFEKQYGSDNVKLVEKLINLGNSYGDLGHYQKQIELLESALAIGEKHYGDDHSELLLILENLCNAYRFANDLQKERELIERALSISEKNYGPVHFEFAKALQRLGVNYGDSGEHQKQKELLERALTINEKHYGAGNFEVAITQVNLGNAYGMLGNAKKQITLLECALPVLEKHYGSDNLTIAVTLEHLSNAYEKLGDRHKKIELREQAFPIFEKHHGSDNYKLAVHLANMGNDYGYLGNSNKQKDLLERALSIFEKHYGSDHLHVGMALGNLSYVYGDLGDHKKQKELIERALPILEKYNHPIVTELKNFLDEFDTLHFACKNGNLEMVETLLKDGSDVFARVNHETVLHRGVISDNKQIIKLIIDKIKEKDPHNFSAHINAKDIEGDTPLMWAAANGKINATNILLEYGVVDLNVQNSNGETALHWGVKAEHHYIVKLLIENQANSKIKDHLGKTPLDSAQEKLSQDSENENLKTITDLLLTV